MNIYFTITESEMDIIAEQYAYDPKSGSKEDFVLEKFKEFGRSCILSKAEQVADLVKEQEKKSDIEAAKDQISF